MLIDRFTSKLYQSGLKMIMYVAVKELYKCDVYFLHSLDRGLYCKIATDRELTQNDISELKNKMQSIIDADKKITKKIVTKKDAYNFYMKIGEVEKAGNVLNSDNKTVTLYELDGFYNYFMEKMIERTGAIHIFDLIYLGNNGIVLSYPIMNDDVLPTYVSQEMILKNFTGYNMWCDSLEVKYVSDLNKIISESKIKEFIKKNDIIIDNQLFELANTIRLQKKKIILLGGPSSSGKTTSTRKLSLYLSALALNPIYISLDDYFKDRSETPKLPNGEYDFESLAAVDLDLFNEQFKKMLAGEKVNIPTYNFIEGKKEFKKYVELHDNDIVLLEGLHCLNEELSRAIPHDKKMKVYISPFMPLSVDRHNHISNLDIRLLRRIVRDNRTRGKSVEETLKMWDLVRDGEEKYIFPFTNEANVILNTAHIYEIGILKVYAEPLLYSVPIDSKYYNESRRLINELQMFFPIPGEYVSDDNILREFIGESYFE